MKEFGCKSDGSCSINSLSLLIDFAEEKAAKKAASGPRIRYCPHAGLPTILIGKRRLITEGHIMKNRRRSVLIANQNRAVAQGIRLHLERAGLSVILAHDLEQASIQAARQRFELMIVSWELPGGGATEFCRHVREELGLVDVPMALSTSDAKRVDLESITYQYGVTRVFNQPFDPADVVAYAAEAVEYTVSTH